MTLLLESPMLIVIIALFYLFKTIKVLSEYERGVIFRLGKLRRCCMKTLRWGGLARISHDPPQDPHYRDEVEGPSHI